jgi:hypothetical protein
MNFNTGYEEHNKNKNIARTLPGRFEADKRYRGGAANRAANI